MSNEIVIRKLSEVMAFDEIDSFEKEKIKKANDLLELSFPEHSLMDIWSAASHNLKRRIEAYSIEMFTSSVSVINSGRKKYNEKGDTLSERWSDVDDHILIYGAMQLKLISKKAYKALEMVNWMRNHSSAAHESDDEVTTADVMGLVQLLANNLFSAPMPDPIHSPIALIEPIKVEELTEYQVGMFKDQISNYSNSNLKIIYGFSLNQIIVGEQPGYDNVSKIFPLVWEKIDEDTKKDIGKKYYDLSFSSSNDESADKKALSRLFDQIVSVDGVKYIPDSCRAVIYRELAKRLAKAKDTMYGWSLENAESKALAQIGPYVPKSVFEEVYQEILAVWCGNYWGRSQGYLHLEGFIMKLSSKEKMNVAKLFLTNKRVREELFLPRPKNYATQLLESIKETLKVESQKNELDNIIKEINRIKE